jgi:hypothetical protein
VAGAGVNGYHLKDQPLNDLKLAIQLIKRNHFSGVKALLSTPEK